VIESGEGKRLAENLIKQLTGGDRLKARRMREDFWDFEPTHKIWLATNHKPVIRGSDHAIWRRIRLIPFQVTIPENEQDKHLLEKLKKELPGILRWMVEGCLLWQREGLETPEEVKNATQKYKTEMDVITNFLNDTCIINSLAKVAVTELYAVYVSWCEENGEHQVSRQNLVSKLEEQGFEKRRGTENKLFLHGIGLLENGKKLPKLSKLRNFRMNARELVRVEVNRKKVNFSNFDNFLGKEGSDEREEPNTSKTKQEAGEYNLDNLPFD
jgi:putative DNA primase/helicase